MNNHKKAFGLISLLITFAIITLAGGAMYSSFLKSKDGGEAPIEQGLSAINEAEKVKQLLEQQNGSYSNTDDKLNTTLREVK